MEGSVPEMGGKLLSHKNKKTPHRTYETRMKKLRSKVLGKKNSKWFDGDESHARIRENITLSLKHP